MKKLRILMLALPALVMTTCEVDNNDTPTIGIPAAGSRFVARVTTEEDEVMTTMDFIYDDRDRLAEVDGKSIRTISDADGLGPAEQVSTDVNIAFDYSLISVGIFKTTAITSGRSVNRRLSVIYTLGQNDYLSSGIITQEIDGESEEPIEWVGTYNADGYLTEGKFAGLLYDATWTGGNLTNLTSGSDGQTEFEYSGVVNNPKCNLDLNHLVTDIGDYAQPFAAIIGLQGRRSANMISAETWVSSYSYGDDPTTLYTYETDSQGFVTKITTIDSDGVESSVMTITYR